MKTIKPLVRDTPSDHITAWIRLALILFICCQSRITATAQNYDYGSVEAYIYDHKQQRSLLMARATLEYGNRLLHEQTAESADGYREVNADLDKYTRAFDVIDVIYQSLRAAVNVYNTYEDMEEIITGYRDMLDAFNRRVVQRGRLEATDTLILAVSYRAVRDVSREAEHLYRSVSDLALYCTGTAACPASDLLVLTESINTSLENIRRLLRSAYFTTWKYVQLRIGFWKGKIYRTHSRSDILEGAFGRWREVTREILP